MSEGRESTPEVGGTPVARGDASDGWPDINPVPRTSTAGIITERLRRAIAAGEFEPGAQLLEAALATGFNVSRGPVREATQRLIQEGLLESRPHRGVFVVNLTLHDITDIYLARNAIEREAAIRVIRTAPSGFAERLHRHIERMREATQRPEDWPEIVDLDLGFHELLVDAAASPRLSRMFSTLSAETRLCIGRLVGGYPQHGDLVDEHRDLLNLLLNGDEAGFVSSLEAHFAAAVELLSNQATPHTRDGGGTTECD